MLGIVDQNIKIRLLTFSIIARSCNKMIIGENLLKKHSAAEGAECNCCDGVDWGGRGRADAHFFIECVVLERVREQFGVTWEE